ncbi:MAG: nucleoside triphosphate pyrophosphohydrolase [Cyanobacteria bacterium J06650_10]
MPDSPMPDSQTPASNITSELQRLVDVIAQLRNPNGGCPWDLAQTPDSLTPYVIEEAYEVVDAIKHGTPQDVEEELGDLLLQVVLQAQIFGEQGAFDLGDIAKGIADKMVRRHPHVFGDVIATSPAAVNKNWDEIKAAEKAEKGETDPNKLSPKLREYSESMPPILGAMKISRKAAKAGFEWESLDEVWEKVEEEIEELKAAIAGEPKANQEGELGDVFFSLIQIARWQSLDPAAALKGTSHRFVQRFEQVEAQADKALSDYSVEELEAFWQKAKQQIAQAKAKRQQ